MSSAIYVSLEIWVLKKAENEGLSMFLGEDDKMTVCGRNPVPRTITDMLDSDISLESYRNSTKYINKFEIDSGLKHMNFGKKYAAPIECIYIYEYNCVYVSYIYALLLPKFRAISQ